MSSAQADFSSILIRGSTKTMGTDKTFLMHEIQIFEYFKFYSREKTRTSQGMPAMRTCELPNCTAKLRNESHYHCKLCDITHRGLQKKRMLQHLVSKHAWKVGLHNEPDPNSEENSRNRGFSVLDHNYTIEQILPSKECMPLFDASMTGIIQEGADNGADQENNPQLTHDEVNEQNNGTPPFRTESIDAIPTPLIESISASIDQNRIITNDFIDRILSGPTPESILATSSANKTAPSPLNTQNKPFTMVNGQKVQQTIIDPTKICVIPKCTKYHEKLRTLVRYKKRGFQNEVDWNGTMLLLTFHKLDRIADLFNKRICTYHWKEWYNFNYRLKQKIPRRMDANTQTEKKYL